MTQYKTWKALDAALSELGGRVVLPDFVDLADEIGKSLRSPSTRTKHSITLRLERLRKISIGFWVDGIKRVFFLGVPER